MLRKTGPADDLLGPADLIALHAPDGFLQPGIAAITAVVSLAIVTLAFRSTASELGDKQVPLAGVCAAFIFAAQMITFPVAVGTTGHLVGAALAAILLGPWVGTSVVAIVIVVQAVVFADGGLTALGYNTLNMAIVPAFAGWALFRLFRRVLPASPGGVMGATGLAAGLSVVLGAAAFSMQWLFGASAPVPFDTVFGAMVGVHTLIGIGEGAISAMVVAAVLRSRPDLVVGARDLSGDELARSAQLGLRPLALAVVAVSFLLATVVSQFAAGGPDGLERVAADTGISASPTTAATASDPIYGGLFADYATSGIGNEALSLAVAGASGVTLTLLVGFGMFSAARMTKARFG